MTTIGGIPTAGRFSEFMIHGALTEPDDDPHSAVYHEPTGIQQAHPIAEGRELTTELPAQLQGTAASQGQIEKPQIWPFIENEDVGKEIAVIPDGRVVSWNGARPIGINLPGKLSIRSILFVQAPPSTISIMSGSQTGTAIYSNIQPTGTINIPDGNAHITLVASAPFAKPISVLVSHLQFAPTQNSTQAVSDFPLGSTPFSYQSVAQVLTTGTLPFTLTGIAAGNSGQSIYLTKFKVIGLAMQRFQVFPSFVGSASATVYNTYSDNGSGLDYDDDLSPAFPIGPLTQNEGLNLKINALHGGDVIVGPLAFSALLLGYVL